jgi:hypothetical protein
MFSRPSNFMRLFLFEIIVLTCGVFRLAMAATVATTPPPVSYTNTVNFNFTSNVFAFFYSGADGTIQYEYAARASGDSTRCGTFNQLTCTVNGTNTFIPSIGGLSTVTANGDVPSWGADVTFTFLSATAVSSNVVRLQFKMTSGTNALIYTLQMQISARTLVIQATVQSGVSGGVILDRCEGAANPVVIHVPYLTTMNVLYVGGAFASMYFDWETTSASTIYPLDSVYSSGSVQYAQQATYGKRTDATRNPLNETIYLTVSPSLPDVLPNLINPVSPYKNISANYLVFDNWQTPFSSVNTQVQKLHAVGVSNLWVIVHNWQNGGYDNKLPNTLPANPAYGGDAALNELAQTIRHSGYLFALHENYADFYTNAAAWNRADVALNSDGSLKKAWFNNGTGIQSYAMKPSVAANYLTNFASQIHQEYNTIASYLDVSPGVNPSGSVDYDATVTNAAMFREALARHRAFGGLLRRIHQGPVSGEGYQNIFTMGYYDDYEAQVNSAGTAPASQYQHLPLLVDFDLLKMHNLAVVHGVGYYERFFLRDGQASFRSYPRSDVLKYMATELAYGHGGFIPTPDRVYNYVAAAQLEQEHVFPAQKQYANAMPASILYHDSTRNDEVSVSDYIRRYPTTFDNHTNVNFMSQVRVTYDNGLVVCVNRHPTRIWQVQLGQAGGNFNYNAVINGTNVQWVGQTNTTTYLLPPASGWVVFSPQSIK